MVERFAIPADATLWGADDGASNLAGNCRTHRRTLVLLQTDKRSQDRRSQVVAHDDEGDADNSARSETQRLTVVNGARAESSVGSTGDDATRTRRSESGESRVRADRESELERAGASGRTLGRDDRGAEDHGRIHRASRVVEQRDAWRDGTSSAVEQRARSGKIAEMIENAGADMLSIFARLENIDK